MIKHSENRVEFFSPDGPGDFIIFSGENRYDPMLGEKIATGTWFGYDFKRFKPVILAVSLQTNSYEVMELYETVNKKSVKVMEFFGDSENFDNILNTIKDFKI